MQGHLGTTSLLPLPGGDENPNSIRAQERQKLLEFVLQGEPVARIARKFGVQRETIYQWTREHEFQVELRGRRESELKAIENRVIYATEVALDTLVWACQGADETKDRIHAAEVILDKAFALRPEAAKKALVEVQTHQHLDFSNLSREDLDNFLTKAKVIEGEAVKSA